MKLVNTAFNKKDLFSGMTFQITSEVKHTLQLGMELLKLSIILLITKL